MSRASEWAKAPMFPREDLILRLITDSKRESLIEAHPVLYPSAVCYRIKVGEKEVVLAETEAVQIARHILDTFGDQP